MTSREKSGTHREGMPGRLGFLMGLFAFLLYLFLPVVFYVHLAAGSLPAASGDLETGAPIMESREGEPASPHDSTACCICQNASSFQDYGTAAPFHAPDSNSRAGLPADGYCAPGFADADVVTAHTRAPPVVPLQPATA
jgi:hypothetical protein